MPPPPPDKYNLFECSDLIGFGCDLSDTQDGLKCRRMGPLICGKHSLLLKRIQVSDTQDGLKCWRMGPLICGKHSLLLTRIQVSNPGPMGPLFYNYLFV